MDTLELVRLNLLSPMVLAFAVGVAASLARSDLKFPDALYVALSIYLLLTIGLKGGVELRGTPAATVWVPLLVTLLIGTATPVWCYAILRRLGKLAQADAAAIAAHYGSVSAVTFLAGLTFLHRAGVPAEGFLPALVAVLEVPAIIVALIIARTATGGMNSWAGALREALAGKAVVLLTGGMFIGFLSGREGVAQVAPFFIEPFHGALTLFLLEMGMVAARRLRDLAAIGPFLIGFAIVMPMLHGILGVYLGTLAGLSVGGSTILGLLAASASYIAAPAAMRIALPQANPAFYLTASLGITFPFNLTAGIPLYYALAQLVHGGG